MLSHNLSSARSQPQMVACPHHMMVLPYFIDKLMNVPPALVSRCSPCTSSTRLALLALHLQHSSRVARLAPPALFSSLSGGSAPRTPWLHPNNPLSLSTQPGACSPWLCGCVYIILTPGYIPIIHLSIYITHLVS